MGIYYKDDKIIKKFRGVMFKKILVLCSVILGTLPALAAEKTFTVGFDANFKPYGYFENGQYKGFDLDLAREVARRNNWKLVLKPIQHLLTSLSTSF